MTPRRFVRPLEEAWRGVLSRAIGRADAYEPKGIADLAPKLEELSRAYNLGVAEGKRTALPLAARAAFSFPRDVPKGAGAVRELVAASALGAPGRPLRVLDLGAGLGAMTWGIARAFAAGGAAAPVRVEALLVDEDAEALRAAQAIARLAAAEPAAIGARLELTIDVRAASVARLPPLAKHDVVVLGQVLSELDIALRDDPTARVEAHADLLLFALEDLVEDAGSLVVVEPALRDRTRHLEAVRDRVLARAPAASVFAPCPHRLGCPMLPLDGEWCHEDLPLDLPPWVVPLARAAGLRYQGLTFSYLVLRKDGRTFGTARAGAARFRVVSDLLRTKGKVELFACTAAGERRRLRRLDRDRSAERGASWEELHRGDLVQLEHTSGPAVDERGRVQPGAHITIDGAAADR